MGTISTIFQRLFPTFGQVKLGGVLTSLTSKEAYPTHIANEGLGGLHIYNSESDLVSELPANRMQIGMSAIINSYTDVDGNTIPRKKYTLLKLLPANISYLVDIPNYQLSEYWEVETGVKGDPGDAGQDGEDGDPLLSQSLSTSALTFANNYSLAASPISFTTSYTTPYLEITNVSLIDKVLQHQLHTIGYTDTTPDAYLTITTEVSQNGVTQVPITPYLRGNRGFSNVFLAAKHSGNFQIFRQNIRESHYLKLEAGETLFVRFRIEKKDVNGNTNNATVYFNQFYQDLILF